MGNSFGNALDKIIFAISMLATWLLIADFDMLGLLLAGGALMIAGICYFIFKFKYFFTVLFFSILAGIVLSIIVH